MSEDGRFKGPELGPTLEEGVTARLGARVWRVLSRWTISVKPSRTGAGFYSLLLSTKLPPTGLASD